MYAFNKRFRPTELLGMPMYGVLSFVFAFALGLLAFMVDVIAAQILFGVCAALLFLVAAGYFYLQEDLSFIRSYIANWDEKSTVSLGENSGE